MDRLGVSSPASVFGGGKAGAVSVFEKILVANRGEIAIRVLRAANEMGKATVAVFSDEDRLALHRSKADESYRIGEGMGPVAAYLSVEEMLRVAVETHADAIHPGYGFLSESPGLRPGLRGEGIVFIGPRPETLRSLGDKVSARAIAAAAGVPTVPATVALPADREAALALANEVGFPGILKASWGGGGRGMRVVASATGLEAALLAARREAAAAFGKDEIYLERFIGRARHLEVQVLADAGGRVVHLFERDCSVQRRNQKIVECAPAPGLTPAQREELTGYALAIAREADYLNAGTVEFLHDLDTGRFHFIEVNPRIQVEHTVTEQVTGVDLVRAQIRIAEGAPIGDGADDACPHQDAIALRGHAVQCRITTEDPLDRFIPDYGRITAYRGATGFGIRLDGGTAYSGAVITRHYDSLLEKITAWAPSREGAIDRMRRALREFRIRGVATNIAFLERLVGEEAFRRGQITTRFIDEHPELLAFARPRDRASRLLRYIAETTVNGHPEAKGRPSPPAHARNPRPPRVLPDTPAAGAKALLDAEGPVAVAQWMQEQSRVLVTDTTMRDAPQSLLATRMRTHDMERVADAYARKSPESLLARMLGRRDVRRGAALSRRVPLGSAAAPARVHPQPPAPDAGARFERRRLHQLPRQRGAGVRGPGRGLRDRPLPHLRSPELGREHAGRGRRGARDRAHLRGGHLLHRRSARLAPQPLRHRLLPPHGPRAARRRHAHSRHQGHGGTGQARRRARAGRGAEGRDRACGALPHPRHIGHRRGERAGRGGGGRRCRRPRDGQPVGIHLAAVSRLGGGGAPGQPRDTGLDPARIREISDYWEVVRAQYAAFETDMRAPASEVYLHEMPGGQFTNLREQARSLGLAERWHEVATTYAEVNRMFGDIVKVTPTSKVVGDLALVMVSGGLTRADVEDPDRDIAFPESVVGLFRGDLGAMPGGFPQPLASKILKGVKPIEGRPGAALPPADLAAERRGPRPRPAGRSPRRSCTPTFSTRRCSWTTRSGAESTVRCRRCRPGCSSTGLPPGREVSVDLDRGLTLVIRCLAIGETDAEGAVRVFYELNGQPRSVKVENREVAAAVVRRPKADSANPCHVAAPMPGVVASMAVAAGRAVAAGDLLMTIEAMKMETALHAERDGTVAVVHVTAGQSVEAKDLLLEFAKD